MIKTMHLGIRFVILAWLLVATQAFIANATSLPTVLHIASERHTSLALNYSHFPQFVRLGYGTPSAPWHPWFGTQEIRTLLYLPDYRPDQPIVIDPSMIVGSRFAGKTWTNGFEALRSFDTDHNGLVERNELNHLYVWIDGNSDGTITKNQNWLSPSRQRYAGFDLRQPSKPKRGYARQGLLAPYSVIGKKTARIHLLELEISDSFASEHLGYLSFASSQHINTAHTFSGEWHWAITNANAWGNSLKSWQGQSSGRLLLAVQGQTLIGMVQYRGAHSDRINLPLTGLTDGHQAEWTSISPLGLTRSQVTLTNEAGQLVLQGDAWSNRNGKIQQWTWKAHHAASFK